MAAGGCLLTDPQFSKRIRDLMEYLDDPDKVPTINDIELLKVGRHFRLSNVGEANRWQESERELHDGLFDA